MAVAYLCVCACVEGDGGRRKEVEMYVCIRVGMLYCVIHVILIP